MKYDLRFTTGENFYNKSVAQVANLMQTRQGVSVHVEECIMGSDSIRLEFLTPTQAQIVKKYRGNPVEKLIAVAAEGTVTFAAIAAMSTNDLKVVTALLTHYINRM